MSNHLLSGSLRCGLCDGNMFLAPRSGKRGEPQIYYVCTTHHKRGNTRCTHRWGVPYHDLTDSILTAIKECLLKPDVIEGVVAGSLADQAKAPDAQKTQMDSIRVRLTALDREIARYTLAIGQTDTEVRPLMEALQARQRERTDLSAKLGSTSTVFRRPRRSGTPIGSGGSSLPWSRAWRSRATTRRSLSRPARSSATW